MWSFSSQQATLRRLNKAFDGFFRRVKVGRRRAIPGSKARPGSIRVQWPKDGDGARWLPDQNRVYLQGIGKVKAEVHREALGSGQDDPSQTAGSALDAGALV